LTLQGLWRGPLSGLMATAGDEDWASLLSEIAWQVRQMLGREPLSAHAADVSLLLVGSAALGVVDEVSDVDLQLVCREQLAEELKRSHRELGIVGAEEDLFVELKLRGGRGGHYTLRTVESLAEELARGEDSALWLAATACALHDPIEVAGLLSQHYPLREEAWLQRCRSTYVAFRQASRVMDNAAERGDGWALLWATTEALRQAHRCALAVDGVPAPYDKWLHAVATRFPTGAAVAQAADACLRWLPNGSAPQPLPHKEHPLVRAVEEVRRVLIAALHGRGIRAPWITHWWRHMG